jgi:hypothetical protein
MKAAQTIRAIFIIDSLTFWVASRLRCSPTYYENDQIHNDCPDVRSGSNSEVRGAQPGSPNGLLIHLPLGAKALIGPTI